MTLEQYANRPSWSEETNQELKSSLTPYKLKLAERNVIVNIIGKRGRIVPVLLTPETKIGIHVLISQRSMVQGINPENNYIFARGLQTLSYMRGCDVLKKIIEEIQDLEKPHLITSTQLRKYIATVCQVFDLSENEYDWLARHLGHDIRVHREFYRLHDDVVELTKVSRLLMVVDSGEASKLAGKQLQDINLTDLPPIEEEDNEEDDVEPLDDQAQEYSNISDNRDMERDFSSKSKLNEPKITEEYISENYDIERDFFPKSKNRKSKATSCKGTSRTAWNVDDKKAVLEFFRIEIKNGIVPGKAACEDCQTQHDQLKNRKWSDIKFCVKNQITKMKNMKK